MEKFFGPSVIIGLWKSQRYQSAGEFSVQQAPILHQQGPWHDSMQSGDVYCCDWNYTTNVWGAPYKKVGTDGAPGSNGSDANVNFENVKKIMEKYYGINTTQIDPGSIYSPFIYGANLIGADFTDTGKGNGIHFLMNGGQQAQIWLDQNRDPALSSGNPVLRIGGVTDFVFDAPSATNGDVFIDKGQGPKRVLTEDSKITACFV